MVAESWLAKPNWAPSAEEGPREPSPPLFCFAIRGRASAVAPQFAAFAPRILFPDNPPFKLFRPALYPSLRIDTPQPCSVADDIPGNRQTWPCACDTSELKLCLAPGGIVLPARYVTDTVNSHGTPPGGMRWFPGCRATSLPSRWTPDAVLQANAKSRDSLLQQPPRTRTLPPPPPPPSLARRRPAAYPPLPPPLPLKLALTHLPMSPKSRRDGPGAEAHRSRLREVAMEGAD